MTFEVLSLSRPHLLLSSPRPKGLLPLLAHCLLSLALDGLFLSSSRPSGKKEKLGNLNKEGRGGGQKRSRIAFIYALPPAFLQTSKLFTEKPVEGGSLILVARPSANKLRLAAVAERAAKYF